jgi:hypothetical protein
VDSVSLSPIPQKSICVRFPKSAFTATQPLPPMPNKTSPEVDFGANGCPRVPRATLGGRDSTQTSSSPPPGRKAGVHGPLSGGPGQRLPIHKYKTPLPLTAYIFIPLYTYAYGSILGKKLRKKKTSITFKHRKANTAAIRVLH